MRKLILKVDELAIESFETLSPLSERGTVRGNASEPANTCGPEDLSYPGSCDPICDASRYAPCPTDNCPPVTSLITCAPTGPDPVNTCCGTEC